MPLPDTYVVLGFREMVFGIVFPVIGGYFVLVLLLRSIIGLIRDIKRDAHDHHEKLLAMETRLLDMHEHADEEGFGTGGVEGEQMATNRHLRDLVHYMRWLASRLGGNDDPPPPTPSPGE